MLDECDRRDIEEHKNYLAEIENPNKILLNFSQEAFIQTLKNRLGWKPNYFETRRDAQLQGLEKALRNRGMKTYCGPHGFCRPYIEEDGMSCK
ncbi:unnamed protein product [Meloidogyne enterolobii]|uniref:Uncharacterized protein n=1 Tax=Meloidogyne enterolobii TaxID=390850 RepID=A0ACB0XNY9_MELEN